MKKRVAISIVIPTYNQGHYLEECLRSIVEQTFTDWEVIVVNDFSDDNTVEVVENFPDQRIRLVNFRSNRIIATSRNKGIELANNDLIAFLDSDDRWYPEKLNRCIQELTPDRDLVCHGMRYIKNGRYWKDVKCGPEGKSGFYSLLCNGNSLITSAVLVRKACLLKVGGFCEDPSIVSAEDYDLWLRLSKEKMRFHFINDILGEYLYHENSASRKVLSHMKAGLAVFDKHFASIGKVTMLERFRMKHGKALFFYGAARSFQHNGSKTEAIYYFMKSVQIFPFMLRAYAGIILSLFTFLRFNKTGTS